MFDDPIILLLLIFSLLFFFLIFIIINKFICGSNQVQDNEETRRQIRANNISEDRFGPDSITTINQTLGLSNIRFRNSPRNRQRNSRYLVHPTERSNGQTFMRPVPPRPNRMNIPENISVRSIRRLSRSITPTSIQVRPSNRLNSSRSITTTTRPVNRLILSRSNSNETRSISPTTIQVRPSNRVIISRENSEDTSINSVNSQQISINIENNNSTFLSSPRASIISSRHSGRYVEYRSNSQSPYLINSENIVNNLSPLRIERFRSPLSSFNFNIVNTYENNQQNQDVIEELSTSEENTTSEDVTTSEESDSDDNSDNSLNVETDINSEEDINSNEINLNELNLSIYKYNKEDNCSICISSMNNMEIINLGCLHKFHKDCLLKWWEYDKNNSSCPLCRTSNFIPS